LGNYIERAKERNISHAETVGKKGLAKDAHRILYTLRTNASLISTELSETVTPYYIGSQRKHQASGSE
jgi:hypothetical protein